MNVPKNPRNTQGKERHDSLLIKQGRDWDYVISILKGRVNPKLGILGEVWFKPYFARTLRKDPFPRDRFTIKLIEMGILQLQCQLS